MTTIQSLGSLADLAPAWLPSSWSWRRGTGGIALDYAAMYRSQPEIRICVDFLARNIAQLGLHVFRRVSDTDRERLTDHGLARLLGRPNYATTRYRQIEWTMHDLGVYGNAIWVKFRNRQADPALSVLRVPPMYVSVAGGLLPGEYEVSVSGKRYLFPPEDVVHFRLPNAQSPIWGLSVIETLRPLLEEEEGSSSYRTAFWTHAARPGGVIQRPLEAPEWSQEARDTFAAAFETYYAGADNAGRTVVLEDGMSWHGQSQTLEESQAVEFRKLNRDIVARSYHIPLPMVGILEHATFCLPGDEEVLTEGGPVPIRAITPGTWVWSRQETGGFALAPVRATAISGYDRVLTIRTSNRTLRANARHPILVRHPVYTTATRQLGGRITADGWQRQSWETTWRPAGELQVGDMIVTLGQLPGGSSRSAPTRPEVSVGFMEFCGLLLGDGNVSTARGEPVGVQIARAEDAPYMDHYRAVLQAEFTALTTGGREYRPDLHRPRPIRLVEGGRQTRFASRSAGRELQLLGLDGTARTKRVPDWVFRLAPDLQLGFLRGFLDADGSVDKKGRISFGSTNQVMLSQMRHLCIGLGIPVTNLRVQRGIGRLPNGQSSAFELFTFTCSDPGQNRRIGSHDPRYQERLAAGHPFGRKARRYPAFGGIGFDEPGCELARVVGITQGEVNEPVYDLEVEGSHSFIASGVVVHNSNIKEQHKQLYQDSLGPWLRMLEEDLELQLLREFADTEGVYVEFNIAEKLAGSFEEQSDALQTAVGRPWMTPDEARARLNLPQVGGDAEALGIPVNIRVGEEPAALPAGGNAL